MTDHEIENEAGFCSDKTAVIFNALDRKINATLDSRSSLQTGWQCNREHSSKQEHSIMRTRTAVYRFVFKLNTFSHIFSVWREETEVVNRDSER